MKELTTEYRGKTITYNTTNDEWTCEDFTHGRGSPTLSLAQKRVDKILDVPGEKPKSFDKVQVWIDVYNYTHGWKLITLTSKAEEGFWATDGKDRKKLSRYDSSKLKADTPQNSVRLGKIQELNTQIESLREELEKIESELAPFKA